MSPAHQSQILENFVQRYDELKRAVDIALQTNNIEHGQTLTREIILFKQRLQQHYRLFQPDELEVMTESAIQMVLHLDDMRNTLMDPPDRPFPLPESPNEPQQGPGRPRKAIDSNLLKMAVDMRRTKRLAEILGVHVRTLRRRALAEGLVEPGEPVYVEYETEEGLIMRVYRSSTGPVSDISDDDLDEAMKSIIIAFPSFGRRLIHGHLKFMGIHIPRSRVVASYGWVVGLPTQLFGVRRINRRIYTVPGPNSLWHHDGQHGLIRYKIVIHAFIDGFSCMVTGIQASNNNRAATVLDVFMESIRVHGCPSRTRGDHGTENGMVAEFMEALRGSNRGSYLYGKSIHNIRIERLWRDVTLGFGAKWKYFFQQLEVNDGLNVSNSHHIWLLQHLFLPEINQDAKTWAESWNRHPISLRHQQSQSPVEMFVFGMMERGLRGMDEIMDVQDDHLVDMSTEEARDTYGVDWDEMDDPAIVSHHNDSNLPDSDDASNPFSTHLPDHFSHVEVESPNCPLSEEQLENLTTSLQSFPWYWNKDMDSRRLVWQAAFVQVLMTGAMVLASVNTLKAIILLSSGLCLREVVLREVAQAFTRIKNKKLVAGSTRRNNRTDFDGPVLDRNGVTQHIKICLVPFIDSTLLTPAHIGLFSTKDCPTFRLFSAALPQLLGTFADYNLVVDVTIRVKSDMEDDLFPSLYRLIARHLNDNDFRLDDTEVPEDPPSPKDLNPLILCKVGRYNALHGAVIAQNLEIAGNQWTLKNLTDSSKFTPLQVSVDRKQVVFVSFIHPLSGKLPDDRLVHNCFGYRLLQAQKKLMRKPLLEFGCLLGCPGSQLDSPLAVADTVSLDPPAATLTSSDAETSTRRRQRTRSGSIGRSRSRSRQRQRLNEDAEYIPSRSVTPALTDITTRQSAIASTPTRLFSPVPSLNPFWSPSPAAIPDHPSPPPQEPSPPPATHISPTTADPFDLGTSSESTASLSSGQLSLPSAASGSPFLSSFDPLPASEPLSDPLSYSDPLPSSDPLSDPLAEPLPLSLASVSSITEPNAWRQSLRNTFGDQGRGFSIQSPTMEVAVSITIAMVKNYHGGATPNIPEDVQVRCFDMKKILMGDVFVTIGRTVQDEDGNILQSAGIGPAPRKAFIRKCIEELTSDKAYFKHAGDLKTWAFRPEHVQERAVYAKTVGTFMALHLQWIGVTGHPLIPALYIIILRGLDYCTNVANIAACIDSTLARQLSKWPVAIRGRINAEYLNPQSDVHQLAVSYLDNSTQVQLLVILYYDLRNLKPTLNRYPKYWDVITRQFGPGYANRFLHRHYFNPTLLS
ncbi:hypothetical protein AAF712_012061 [Marasmius tenuissimus]|uniref:Integrase catalytic domain-containing protein n=1 Tax=Marasmius tenuissimus TaxID=585030 RepID=A0ABR2ZJG6_9AGAR